MEVFGALVVGYLLGWWIRGRDSVARDPAGDYGIGADPYYGDGPGVAEGAYYSGEPVAYRRYRAD